MPRKSLQIRRRSCQRGFVLITMGVAAVALFGALGMAIDLGRMFIVKNETQAFCDAGAIAAVLQIDGTSNGVSNAKSAVTNSTNKWNLSSTSISSPGVVFAKSGSGPWVANPNPATDYVYVKVSTTVTMPLYFIAVVVGNTTQDVSSTAIAGQVGFSSGGGGGGGGGSTSSNVNPVFRHGLAPYTSVSTDTTGPTFGFTVGTSYDIQWPNHSAIGTGGCSSSNPANCFVKNPCTGDANNSSTMTAVVSSWGPSISGYWGSSSNADIQQEILDLKQLGSVDVGTNLGPAGLNLLTNGNKMAEAGYLDDRVNEDLNVTDNTVSAYLASAHNGRRLISVPIVDPVDTNHTNVIGYGVFLLYASKTQNGNSNYYKHNQNGNDPYCAMYAGCYLVGSPNPGQPSGCGNTGAGTVGVTQ